MNSASKKTSRKIFLLTLFQLIPFTAFTAETDSQAVIDAAEKALQARGLSAQNIRLGTTRSATAIVLQSVSWLKSLAFEEDKNLQGEIYSLSFESASNGGKNTDCLVTVQPKISRIRIFDCNTLPPHEVIMGPYSPQRSKVANTRDPQINGGVFKTAAPALVPTSETSEFGTVEMK